jgi:uncharacterized protein (TIGR03083 family)
MTLSYDRYCAEILAQTELLVPVITAADLAVPVPSCPGWNVANLVRHVGGVQRWAEHVVRTRATGPVGEDEFDTRRAAVDTVEDPAELASWLLAGASELARQLRSVGPDTPLWTPVPASDNALFYARRFTHETAMHRADATIALGAGFTIDPDVALDTIDEWMALGSLPIHFEVHPRTRELLGPGRTLHFHATDTPQDAGAEWVVDLTGDTLAWRRAHEKAAVAVRGPLTELLLLIYKRRAVDGPDIEVVGDRELLDFWLDRVSFG